jgi:hypothetical protein
MLPRRHRDRHVANLAMEEEMRRLHARIYVMETAQIRSLYAGDICEGKREEVKDEGDVREDVAEECLLRVVVKMGAREKMEIRMYEGNLDVEEFLDWIRAMEKYFKYAKVDDEKKATSVAWHRSIWIAPNSSVVPSWISTSTTRDLMRNRS